jgi:hypothetical protein
MKTTIETVQCDLGNGNLQMIPNLSPASEVDQDLALINVQVISSILELLPSGSFSDIALKFSIKLQEVGNVHDYVELLEEEARFHRSVNLLTIYKQERETKKEKTNKVIYEKERQREKRQRERDNTVIAA